MSSGDTSYPPNLWGGKGDPSKLTITVPTPTALVVNVPTTIRTSLENDSDNDWGQITNTGVWTSPQGALVPADLKYETKDLGGTDWVVANLVSDGNGGLTVTGRYPIPPNLDAESDVRLTATNAAIDVINGTSTIRKNGKVLTTTSYVYNISDAVGEEGETRMSQSGIPGDPGGPVEPPPEDDNEEETNTEYEADKE